MEFLKKKSFSSPDGQKFKVYVEHDLCTAFNKKKIVFVTEYCTALYKYPQIEKLFGKHFILY